MRKTETEKKDEIIIGAENIEKLFKRTFAEILRIKQNYELPIVKEGGFPVLHMGAFLRWKAEYEIQDVPPHLITISLLEPIAKKQRLKKMEDKALTGIDEICQYTDKPREIIIRWVKTYLDCPIKTIDRVYSVGTRALCVWMNENGISWGKGHGRFAY
jgi:hypothetical protein